MIGPHARPDPRRAPLALALGLAVALAGAPALAGPGDAPALAGLEAPEPATPPSSRFT